MSRKLDASVAEALLTLLPADGSAIGNTALREALEKKLGQAVDEYAYNTLRDELVEHGKLAKGKGRSGSVRLVKPAGGDFTLAAHNVSDEELLASDKLVIPSLFHQEPLRKRILLALNIDLIVQHLLRYVGENLEHIEPVFDEERPIGSTREMRTWYTTKRCQATRKSQVSHVVVDSEQDRAKRSALDAWVKGVNTKGGFGVWCSDVVFEPAEIQDFLARHSRVQP